MKTIARPLDFHRRNSAIARAIAGAALLRESKTSDHEAELIAAGARNLALALHDLQEILVPIEPGQPAEGPVN